MWQSTTRLAAGLPSGCLDRSAVSFRLDASSRLPAHREAGLSSTRTRAAAVAATLGAVDNLRLCGGRAASRVAVRSLSRLPTPRAVAGRIADALDGRWSKDQAPVRDGRLARMRMFGHVFAPDMAAKRAAELRVILGKLTAPQLPDAPQRGVLVGRLRQNSGVLPLRGDRGFKVVPHAGFDGVTVVAAARWVGIRSVVPARQATGVKSFHGATVGVRLRVDACDYLQAFSGGLAGSQHVHVMAEMSAFGHGALQGKEIELHRSPSQCLGHLYVLLDLSLAVHNTLELALVVQRRGSADAWSGSRAATNDVVGVLVDEIELWAGSVGPP